MIAVTFAHPSESRDFLRLIEQSAQEIAVFHTGIGAATCRKRLEPFLDGQRFDYFISSGFAGGLEPSLGVGELILAENYSDPQLLSRAREMVSARVARLVTTEHVIESAEERAHLAKEKGAAAVDMETEWIARACASRKIPLLSLRAISDTAAAPFPAPPDVLFDLERQRTNLPRLAGYLVTHPLGIVRLARFARQMTALRHHLAQALVTLVQ